MQSILFFKIGAIGDVLMTTPLLRQAKISGAKVGYLVGKRSSAILQGNTTIDELFTFAEKIFEKKTLRNIIGMISLIRKLRELRKHYFYKTIVVLDRHRIFGLIAKLAGFQKRVGLDRLGKDGKFLTHKLYRDKQGREVEHYLELGSFIGVKPNLDDQSYEYVPTESKKVEELFAHMRPQWKKKCIGIALGGGNQLSKSIHGSEDCRRWPLEKWKILIKHFLDQGYDVFAFGGPTDRKLEMIHAGYHDMTGRFSLRESIDAMSYMDVMVCQESGSMHFGACAGVPVIVMAGPTDPQRLYPYHTRTEKYAGERIWKMTYECYDAYGSFAQCTGTEMDMISVNEVYTTTLTYL